MNTSKFKAHYLIFFVLVTSTVFLYLHVMQNFPDFALDNDRSYIVIAEHIYTDGAFSLGNRDQQGDLILTGWRTPLAPYLAAMIFHLVGDVTLGEEVLKAIFIILNIGTIFVVFQIGKMFHYAIGCFAVVIAMFDVSAFVWANNYQMPDTLFAFFIVLFLYYFIKLLNTENPFVNRKIFLCSLFLGFASLTKPASYYLWGPLFFFLVAFLFRKKNIQGKKILFSLLLFLSIQLLCIGGWMVRNYHVTGSYEFSTMGGQHMLFWNAAYLKAYQEGIPFSDAKMALKGEYLPLAPESEGQKSKYFGDVGRKIIFASPFDYGMTILTRIPKLLLGSPPPDYLFSKEARTKILAARTSGDNPVKFFSSAGTLFTLLQSETMLFPLAWFGVKFYLTCLYVLSVVGLIFMYRKEAAPWVLGGLLLILVYFVAVTCPAAHDRHRAPIMPIFYLLSGYALHHITSRKSLSVKPLDFPHK